MGDSLTIFAFGSAGDTRPLVALGSGLKQRGFGVRMLTSARYGELVRAAGIEHDVLDVDPMTMIDSDQGREWISHRNPVNLVRGFRDFVQPMAERLLEQALESASRSQAVLAPATGFVGAHVGEHLGIPHGLLHLQPGEPTRTAANPLVLSGRSLGPALNRASYETVEQITWLLLRSFTNRWRSQRLGLAPIGWSGPFRMVRRAQVPVFCGFSEVVVPRPPDWPANVHQTGYWFLDDPGGDLGPAVDPVLARFVADGPPPVYAGFGSMLPKDPQRTAVVVRQALRLAGARGVLLGPADRPAEVDGDVITVPSAPHGWLFPRCTALVHHGGAGTTAAGLRAGVPSVITPFFSDQPFWASRVAALGAGPASIAANALTAPELAWRIRQAAQDDVMRQRAGSVAAALAAEDGVSRAADLVERWLDHPAREQVGPQAQVV